MEKAPHLKIGLVGEQGVGKTHIINRYIANRLPQNTASTIGVEFATTVFELRDGSRFKVQIWDTAGQEQYKSIACVHLKNADGVIIVYDIVNSKSFIEVERWKNRIQTECGNDVSIVLVGNKLDLVEKNPSTRKVKRSEAQDLALKHNFQFCEISANRSEQLDSVVQDLLEGIVLKRSARNLERLADHESIQPVSYCGSQCGMF